MSAFSTDDPKLSSLVQTLNDYYDKTRNGMSTGIDYQKATNVLRDHYDNGLLPQEVKNDVAKKLKYYAQNAGRSLSNDAPSVINKIKEEGGFVKKLGQSGFARVLPMLGLGAAALGAANIANKFMNGDKAGAAVDAADMATDSMPVIGTVKQAVKPSEIGYTEEDAAYEDPTSDAYKARVAALRKLQGGGV